MASDWARGRDVGVVVVVEDVEGGLATTVAAASAAQYWSYLGFQIHELPRWEAPWAAARR